MINEKYHDQKSLLPDVDKKPSWLFIMLLIMLLNTIIGLFAFDAGKDEMKMEACNSSTFRCDPEDYIVEK